EGAISEDPIGMPFHVLREAVVPSAAVVPERLHVRAENPVDPRAIRLRDEKVDVGFHVKPVPLPDMDMAVDDRGAGGRPARAVRPHTFLSASAALSRVSAMSRSVWAAETNHVPSGIVRIPRSCRPSQNRSCAAVSRRM